MEIERLAESGKVKIGDAIIQSYHRMEAFPLDENDIPIVTEMVVVEEKVNGANIRVYRHNGELMCLTRGGFREPKTEEILKKLYGNGLNRFFDDNPTLVPCGEIIGKDTIANLNSEWYNEHYGTPNVFLVFDVFEVGEEGRWLNSDEVGKLCDSYGLYMVPRLGYCKDGESLLKLVEYVKEVNEGVVIKTYPKRERDKIWKLKWEHFSKHFQDRVAKTERTKEEDEAVAIVDHFLQGYPQPELGLDCGIGPPQKERYEKLLTELRDSVKTDRSVIGKKVGEIREYLIGLITTSGNFQDEQVKKIAKVIRQRLGRVVSQAMAHGPSKKEKTEVRRC